MNIYFTRLSSNSALIQHIEPRRPNGSVHIRHFVLVDTELVTQLDHRVLNEIEGLNNPTSENLGAWVLAEARAAEPSIFRVRVRETASSSVTVEVD